MLRYRVLVELSGEITPSTKTKFPEQQEELINRLQRINDEIVFFGKTSSPRDNRSKEKNAYNPLQIIKRPYHFKDTTHHAVSPPP